MKLSSIVNLFRASGRPEIKASRFSASVDFTPKIIKIVEEIRSQDGSVFEEILVDKIEFLDNEPLPEAGNKISFILLLPGDSANSFHSSIKGLLNNAPQISKGELPVDYYLVEEDYYSLDEGSLPQIETLFSICSLIKKISGLAHYHDSKTTTDHYRLVFIQPDDMRTASFELETTVSEEMLNCPPLDISFLSDLSRGDANTDLHHNEKVGVFRTTLVEFLSTPSLFQAHFLYLVKNWDGFVEKYQRNLGTYLSGFAFHKAKREIAESEFNLAEQFSKVISEIAGKLLSIPVSFAIVIIVSKSTSPLEIILLITGLLIASIIIAGAVRNQQFQLNRIGHAKKVMFDAIEGKNERYPEDLKISVDEMVSSLDKNEKNLRILLWTYRCLCWVPPILSSALFYYLFS